ncbi:50S ribosome-binding GTPase [Synechococcus sp. CBW1002]|uniref:GTPase domain-containing protein n=1 Tax=Synechococcus sp. CBW1002 TaxID=1353134 RepID=UPI0018CFD6B8|nr:GTPase domain-containing protein [Synechococcus sp. CBW1002]QPN59735.1 50S ribosome-binding GTPase [Synechococcus sp. CBW1002]
MATFQLPELQRRIQSSLDSLQAFLLARGEHSLQEKANALEQQRLALGERALLSLAFSGQYSAGKSTIISALTGRSDIHISADVATDEVQAYRWREIELWDTPGLFADRPDHTAKAEQALRDADLIVYCLTTNLFDTVTAADFRRLAFENGFAPKIFLVINKLSMADVEDTDDYINNLTVSIDRTLAPHHLNGFNHAFIDAQDFREGVADGDDILVQFSRFEGFIQQLNGWVKQQGLLARLDPPIRLGLTTIDEALGTLPDGTFQQNPELFLLNQQLRIVQSQQRRTAAEVRRISTGVVQHVQLLGEQLLSGELGEEENQATSSFRVKCEEINKSAFDDLNGTLQEAYAQLQSKLDDFAREPFVAEYFASVEAGMEGTVPRRGEESGAKVNPIKDIAKNLLDRGAENFAFPGGIMTTSSQVAGTAGHQLVYTVGKFLGKDFRPWEAVNIAKGLGQAVGILSIAMAAYSVYDHVNEEAKVVEKQRQADQQLSEARSQIRKLAEAMAAQVQDIYQQEYDLPVVGVIVERLNAARDVVLAREASNKELVEGLSSYRFELKSCLQQLYATDREGGV